MEYAELSERLTLGLERAGFSIANTTISGLDSIVATRRKFHLPTLSSIHASIGLSSGTVLSMEGLQTYTNGLLEYARKTKSGLPLGFQTGVVCLATLAFKETSQESLTQLDDAPPIRQFASLGASATIDMGRSCIYKCGGQFLAGRVYLPIITDLVETVCDACSLVQCEAPGPNGPHRPH